MRRGGDFETNRLPAARIIHQNPWEGLDRLGAFHLPMPGQVQICRQGFSLPKGDLQVALFHASALYWIGSDDHQETLDRVRLNNDMPPVSPMSCLDHPSAFDNIRMMAPSLF